MFQCVFLCERARRAGGCAIYHYFFFFFFTFYKSKNILGLSEMCINYYILIKRLQGQFFFGIICTTESFTVRRELKG